MPQALKLRNGVWEWDASLGEQCAAEYDRVVWHAPRPEYDQWTVDDGGNVVEITTPPVSPDLVEATSIMADTAAVEAVQRVVARVAAVAALGVAIEDWTIQGVLDAAEAAIAAADAERGALILRHGACLHAEWLRVAYHCRGEIVTADRLWPYLYQLATAEA